MGFFGCAEHLLRSLAAAVASVAGGAHLAGFPKPTQRKRLWDGILSGVCATEGVCDSLRGRAAHNNS